MERHSPVTAKEGREQSTNSQLASEGTPHGSRGCWALRGPFHRGQRHMHPSLTKC